MRVVRRATRPPRIELLVCAIGLAEAVVYGFSFPWFSLTLEARGESAFVIGLNAMVGPIGAFIAGPFVPTLIVRMGYQRFSALAFAMAAAVFLALLVEMSTPALFVMRIILITALSGLWIATEAWINHVVREQHRGFINGLFQTGYSLGFFLGPVLYGAVGAGMLGPIAAALIGLAAAAASLTARHTAVADGDIETASNVDWRVAWNARGILAIALLTGGVETAMYTLLPIYGIDIGMAQQAALTLLVVYTFGEVVLTLPLGWAADRYDRRKVLAACGLVAAASLLSLIWIAEIEPVAWLAALIAGGTVVSLYNLALVMVGERYRGANLPVVSSAFSMAYSVGCASGSVLGGLSMDVAGPTGLMLFAGACLVGFVFLALRLFAPSPAPARPVASLPDPIAENAPPP